MNVSVCSDWAFWFFFLSCFSRGSICNACGPVTRLKSSRRKFAAQQEWNRQLLLQQAALADPQRIDTLARKDLGMISPSPQQVIQWGGPDAPSAPQQGNAELARNFTAAGEPNAGEP